MFHKVTIMEAYKLVRKLKDGSLAPLFINQRMIFPIGEWVEAECHPTKGFKVRPFFHCAGKPEAPHLSMKNRVWVKVDIQDYEEFNRPEHQGGLWFLAKKMRVIQEVFTNQ